MYLGTSKLCCGALNRSYSSFIRGTLYVPRPTILRYTRAMHDYAQKSAVGNIFTRVELLVDGNGIIIIIIIIIIIVIIIIIIIIIMTIY